MSNQERLLRRGQLAELKTQRDHLEMLIDGDVFVIAGAIDLLSRRNRRELIDADKARAQAEELYKHVHAYRDAGALMNEIQEALGEPVGDSE